MRSSPVLKEGDTTRCMDARFGVTDRRGRRSIRAGWRFGARGTRYLQPMRAPCVRAGLVALVAVLAFPAAAPATPAFTDPGFAYQPLVAGLARPTAVAW